MASAVSVPAHGGGGHRPNRTPLQAFCVAGQAGCGPTLPPLPPPATQVHFSLGGRCLSTNASFPCAGGWGTSCPTFLDDCASADSLWIEQSGGVVESHAHPGAVLNVRRGKQRFLGMRTHTPLALI